MDGPDVPGSVEFRKAGDDVSEGGFDDEADGGFWNIFLMSILGLTVGAGVDVATVAGAAVALASLAGLTAGVALDDGVDCGA